MKVSRFTQVALVLLFMASLANAQRPQNQVIDFAIAPQQGASINLNQQCQVPPNSEAEFVAFFLVVEGNDLDQLHSPGSHGTVGPTAIQYRSKSSQSSWGRWFDLPPGSHSEVSPFKLVSELVFLDRKTSAVECRIQTSNPPGNINVNRLLFNFFSPKAVVPNLNNPNHFESGGARGGLNCPLPPYVTRTGWGCPDGQSPSCNPPAYTTVSHLIVHHSAGANSSSNWAGIVLSYWNYHTNGNGWCDIGYNWLIDANGLLYEGRGGGDNVRGAHMCAHNTYTMGLCVMGTYMTVLPTNPALDMLTQLLAWKSTKEGINPVASSWHSPSAVTLPHIAGHRDGCSPGYTSCPGNLLHAHLPTVRTDVEAFINGGCSSCALNTTVTSNFNSGVHTYKASGTLDANNDISGTADVTYQGGTLVKMNMGFKVLPGATFKANLSGCN